MSVHGGLKVTPDLVPDLMFGYIWVNSEAGELNKPLVYFV